jgi:hypothetical protein
MSIEDYIKMDLIVYSRYTILEKTFKSTSHPQISIQGIPNGQSNFSSSPIFLEDG